MIMMIMHHPWGIHQNYPFVEKRNNRFGSVGLWGPLLDSGRVCFICTVAVSQFWLMAKGKQKWSW
jgi:hypothetical protein